MMENRSVGSIIKEWRKTHKLKLREVAATIKISISALSDIEQGRRNASPKVLTRVSEVVGQDLLGFRKRTYKELKAENARLRAQLDWTPVERAVPEKNGAYQATRQYSLPSKRNVRLVEESAYDTILDFACASDEEVIAWREIPQAWEGKTK